MQTLYSRRICRGDWCYWRRKGWHELCKPSISRHWLHYSQNWLPEDQQVHTSTKALCMYGYRFPSSDLCVCGHYKSQRNLGCKSREIESEKSDTQYWYRRMFWLFFLWNDLFFQHTQLRCTLDMLWPLSELPSSKSRSEIQLLQHSRTKYRLLGKDPARNTVSNGSKDHMYTER